MKDQTITTNQPTNELWDIDIDAESTRGAVQVADPCPHFFEVSSASATAWTSWSP